MKSNQSNDIKPTNFSHSPFFQKESNDFFGKSEKPFFNASPIQANLTVNQPNDPYEKEADAMADKVVQRLSDKTFSNSENNPTPFFTKSVKPIQRKCASCEQEQKLQEKEDEQDLLKDKLQKKRIVGSNADMPDEERIIHRKCAACNKEEEQLQKKEVNNSLQSASLNIESNLNSSRGSGSPLQASTREQMENSFDADFSNVRIHGDSSAVKMSKDLNAQAFTHGSDIYFNSGKYDTNSTTGRHLLAHELTHVVQQDTGSIHPFIQRRTIREEYGAATHVRTLWNVHLTITNAPEGATQSLSDFVDACHNGILNATRNLGNGQGALSRVIRVRMQYRSRFDDSEIESLAYQRALNSVLPQAPAPVAPPATSPSAPATPTAPATAVVTPSPQTITGVAASISWIHPSSPAGSLPVVGVPDPTPPDTISRAFLNTAAGFRFSNHVAATITSNDGTSINVVQHDPVTITRGVSQFGLQSQQYNTARNNTRGTSNGIEFLEITQLVGARTVTHEVVGERTGNVVGGAGGLYAGAKIGGGIGTFFGPGVGTAIGAGAGAIIGGIGGWLLGGEVGEQVAMRVVNFPPIWTELKLRIYADGRIERNMLRHSYFPSVHFYGTDNYVGGLNYLALSTEQSLWEDRGWNGGNPWGVGRLAGR